ncbi:putative toxin-antitoxin system toxin component, PIN family [Candidatus Woesearchaeota archaeon]|nr:putative toxin-antitoxin system toxin component, PIN family [Candidatus Woesearchaeota archaeon]
MIRVTLDTNVLVSGSFWTGASFRILELIDQKRIGLVLSKEITEEYARIINSGEIIDKVEQKQLILSALAEKVMTASIHVVPTIKLDVVKNDPDDNKILECAVSGNADYIISYDKHLLIIQEFRGIKILTPEGFLRSVQQAP